MERRKVTRLENSSLPSTTIDRLLGIIFRDRSIEVEPRGIANATAAACGIARMIRGAPAAARHDPVFFLLGVCQG
jgi:hypothetical protein